MRTTTSTSLPISAPAWLRTGRPTSPASETMASRTARVASIRRGRSSRRARKRGAPGSGGRRDMAITFLGARAAGTGALPAASTFRSGAGGGRRQRRCEDRGSGVTPEGGRGGHGLLGGSPGCTASPPLRTTAQALRSTSHATGRIAGHGRPKAPGAAQAGLYAPPPESCPTGTRGGLPTVEPFETVSAADGPAVADLCRRASPDPPPHEDLLASLFDPSRPALVRGDPERGVVATVERNGQAYVRL